MPVNHHKQFYAYLKYMTKKYKIYLILIFFLKQISIKYILNICKMHGAHSTQIFKVTWAGTAELLSIPPQISFNILVTTCAVYKSMQVY
jgi:hypothetical protein